MKRFYFSVLFLALFCLLTISISAVTGAKADVFGEITYVSGVNENTTIQDKASRVVLLNTDGTYSTYPAYYISDVKLQWQGTVQYKFDALNTALGTSYDMDSIVRIEILTDSTIMNQNGGSFQNRKNLKEVVFPSGTKLTSLCGQQFKSSAIEYCCIPASVKSIGVNLFEDCQSLKEVTFAEDFYMESVPAQIFNGCSSLERVIFPDCFVKADGNIFNNCGSLKEVRFGKNFATYPTGNGLSMSNTVTIYAYPSFLSNISNISRSTFSGYLPHYANTATLFLVGTRADAEALVAKASMETLKNAALIEWDPSKPDSYYIPESPTAWTIIYGYNSCTHQWSEKDEVKVTDFYSPIEVGKLCTKCNAIVTSNTIAPIFACKGSSFTEKPDAQGRYHMTVGYSFNCDSYNEYTEYAPLGFGFVACFVDMAGETPLAVSDNGVTAKSKGTYVSRCEYADVNCFDVKLMGISSQAKGKELLLCIFVFDGAEIYYLSPMGQSKIAKGEALNIK